MGWCHSVSESSEPRGRAGREGHQVEQTRVGSRRGRAGLPQGPTHSSGAIPEPRLSHGSDCSTQTVHPHSSVIGKNLNTALNALASSVVPFVIYFFN